MLSIFDTSSRVNIENSFSLARWESCPLSCAKKSRSNAIIRSGISTIAFTSSANLS